MATPTVMIQGTGSHVGKSLIVAGLCRALANRGLKVAPFKPQNMSNNAAVTVDGGEIGRAQALQALASRLPASVHMNPVLLKPESDIGAQVVVQGKRFATLAAAEYTRHKAALLPRVLESFAIVGAGADIVIVEGAGSPAEVNLRAGDIANMGFAEAADVPVVLVGDIDRGGVIASLVGTHALLTASERARVRGFLVNKLRGDAALFADGVRVIEARTGWPSLGVVPWFAEAARLPAEDVLGLDGTPSRSSPSPVGAGGELQRGPSDPLPRGGLELATSGLPSHRSSPRKRGPRSLDSRVRGNEREGQGEAAITIAVPMLSRIANFDDLDPLRLEPGVSLVMVRPGEPIPASASLIILPGSKSTIADLAFLRRQGWDIDILAHHRRGGRVLGLCAGYQMLGRTIADPDGVEGAPGAASGLGLIEVDTVLGGDKTTVAIAGTHVESGAAIAGYEIHLGRTAGPDRARPFVDLGGHTDGARSADGLAAGTYVHGIFAGDGFRRAYLATLGAPPSDFAYGAAVDTALDRLAAHIVAHVDIEALLAIAGYSQSASAASETPAKKSALAPP